MSTHDEGELFHVLREIFHLESFRPLQLEIISHILTKQDVLAILPTGGGKSLCYQLPAICQPGLTIVVSPLLSLINDQLCKLKQLHVKAAAITSQISYRKKLQIKQQLQTKQLKIVFLSPEQLANPQWAVAFCRCHVATLVVDEAHCLAEWGESFRPAYVRIGEFITRLPVRPTVAAFTATATPTTAKKIERSLGLINPLVVRSTAMRRNLHLNIHRCQNFMEKAFVVICYLAQPQNLPAIVYCSTRADVDQITHWLQQLAATFPEVVQAKIESYHAGMPTGQRQMAEREFLSGRANILVATTAFGMGVDKANIRLVLHWQIPTSIENFCQEIGRAGRDQLPAQSALCFVPDDRQIHQILLRPLAATKPTIYRQKLTKLAEMLSLADSSGCHNRRIKHYFGEQSAALGCKLCSNCHPTVPLSYLDRYLLHQLIEWQSSLKQQSKLPVPLLTTLGWLAVLKPRTLTQLRSIPGIGTGWIAAHATTLFEMLTLTQRKEQPS